MQEGAPAPQELAKSFRKVADAMLDAEAEPPDATLMDRLLSGARSIVRVRKAGHAADDTSLEAVIGRMEAALKDGRLADVLANAKKLPPKAALAGEDWVKKVEARQAVEQAMAEVEAPAQGVARRPKPAQAGRTEAQAMIRIVAFLRRHPGRRRRPALAGRPAGHHRRRVAGLCRRDQRLPRLRHPRAGDGLAHAGVVGAALRCGRARPRSAASSTGGGRSAGSTRCRAA